MYYFIKQNKSSIMVNMSTPASYIPLQVSQLDVEAEELLTHSGVISPRTNFVQLVTEEGVKIGGKNNYSNIKLYGVNGSSTIYQYIEI